MRISLRGLLRAPMMTLTIVATVGLGIGATTVIFGAIHAALLRPLPYADPDRLVRIYTDAPPNKFRFSVADYLALQAQQTQFERIAGYTDRPMAFSDGTQAERLRGREVSWTYFALLGMRPPSAATSPKATAGRAARPPSSSARFLAAATRGPADAIGKTDPARRRDYTVVGVLPERSGRSSSGRTSSSRRNGRPPPRKGPFFITPIGRLRQESERSAAAERAARDQPPHLSALAVLVPGREGDVEHDGPEDARRRRRGDDGGPRAGGGGAGLADRVRERVEPAGRARDEPPPRAGRARGARRVARARRAVPAGGKRRCSRSGPPRSGWRSRGRASASCAIRRRPTSRACRKSRSTGRCSGCSSR